MKGPEEFPDSRYKKDRWEARYLYSLSFRLCRPVSFFFLLRFHFTIKHFSLRIRSIFAIFAMKFTLFAAAAFLISGVSAAAVEKRDVPAKLIPQFGLKAGLNPTGTLSSTDSQSYLNISKALVTAMVSRLTARPSRSLALALLTVTSSSRFVIPL